MFFSTYCTTMCVFCVVCCRCRICSTCYCEHDNFNEKLIKITFYHCFFFIEKF